MNTHRVPLLVLIAGAAIVSPGGAGTLYTITDLGELTAPPNPHASIASVLGGENSEASALAGPDRIVGRSADPVHRVRAVSWNALGVPTALGPEDDAELSQAFGVNAAGDAVGFSSIEGGIDAFFWAGTGGHTNIGTLGGPRGYALDVNSSGLVAGYAVADSVVALEWFDRAFSWTAGGGLATLGTLPLGTTSRAAAVNSSGVIVGVSTDASGRSRAVQWQGGSAIDLAVAASDANSEARDINNAGGIVGVHDTGDETTHAFYRDPSGVVHDLGTLPGGFSSQAEAINAAGWIVGASDVDSSSAEAGIRHAVLWQGPGPIIDLHSVVSPPGWLLLEANDIDDNGNIVGVGINPDGRRHGFLLTTQTTAVVLETFAGFRHDGFPHLEWRVATPTGARIASVVVERAEAADGPYIDASRELPATRDLMTFIDQTARSDASYWYRLRLRFDDGDISVSRPLRIAAATDRIENALVVVAPFGDPTVLIRYAVATPGPLTLDVVAVDGRRIRRLEHGTHAAGEYERSWDRRDDAGGLVARGIYLVRLETGAVVRSQKVVVLRR